MIDWPQKTIAFLHDPPEKAYDFSRRHQERAEHYSRRLGLSEALWLGKSPDWTAAAADRFIFPDPAKATGFGQGVSFRHPLTGLPLPLAFPADLDAAAHLLDDSLPEYPGDLSDSERFHLLWRCWPTSAASHPAGSALPYLPADTRIPDSSIWQHNSIVSALEGSRASDGALRPSFLILQIGPVQDFIAQARSTRDLWSGSFLLSWLMAHALRKLAQDLGPDAVVFPSLRGQPLVDWLSRDLLKRASFSQGSSRSRSFWDLLGLDRRQADVLVPNLPNRLLAIVPEGYDASAVEAAIRSEWSSISSSCLQFLAQQHAPISGSSLDAWHFQASHFLQVHWSVRPWDHSPESTLENLQQTGSPHSETLRNHAKAATAIPSEVRDTRCYPLNPGIFWSAHFALASHLLDARRACRDFAAWETHIRARNRDAFSGCEEALIDASWLARARRSPALRHLFKGDDKLGAINLIKRVWHSAYLQKEHGLHRRNTAFDSVYAVAAGAWKAKVIEALREKPDAWSSFIAFAEAAHAASEFQSVAAQVPPPPSRTQTQDESRWLAELDAELLSDAGWKTTSESQTSEPREIAAARKALRSFLKVAAKGEPTAYYAVIALDGDRVGEWLSGAHTPEVGTLLNAKARDYFTSIPGAAGWLNGCRPLSPAFHLAFSEALSNFGLYAASRVVEAHHGQLIYSGGDDVLAMVPAEEAIACAESLRMAFQGDPELAARCPHAFLPPPAPGMILLKTNPGDGLPTWPLIVPAGMTASAGIAIGHAKAALQDMVETAREAEARAKRAPAAGGYGRNAIAVSLVKRSGEIIHWGAPFGSHALRLLEHFQRLFRSGVLPGTFGNRVPGLVSRLAPAASDVVTDSLAALVRAEVSWAWEQLEGGSRTGRKEAALAFFETLDACLAELASRGAPVTDFTNLFAVETFLKRHTA